MDRIMLFTGLSLAVLPLAQCERPVPTPASPCVGNFQGVSTGTAAATDAWLDAHRPLDYRGSATGIWVDGAGRIIGWSAQEDSAICAFVP